MIAKTTDKFPPEQVNAARYISIGLYISIGFIATAILGLAVAFKSLVPFDINGFILGFTLASMSAMMTLLFILREI